LEMNGGFDDCAGDDKSNRCLSCRKQLQGKSIAP
jgi:hypothetical protein